MASKELVAELVAKDRYNPGELNCACDFIEINTNYQPFSLNWKNMLRSKFKAAPTTWM